MINISGLDKAAVLAALYNRAQVQGMGWLHADLLPMTIEQAREILPKGDDHAQRFWLAGRELYFDYLKGRVMKVDLSRDELDPRLYDRDNGQGAAEQALRKAGLIK